jgi:hypothetical protein
VAHKEQQEFFKRIICAHSLQISQAQRVLEIGSQNINGTVRDYFPHSSEYLGLDLGMSECVDWVIPGELVELPDSWADISISTECFEHCNTWIEVFTNMIRITKQGGLVIVTCAGIGRATHGTIDSDEESSPFTTSYYRNLSADDFMSRISVDTYFDLHGFEVNSVSCDLYFWGIRSDKPVREIDHYWEDPIARLARAQGQLAQAAARHTALQKAFQDIIVCKDRIREDLDQAVEDAESARADAKSARADAESARADAESARADAESARADALAMKEVLEKEIKAIKNSRSWRLFSKATRILRSNR